MKNKNIIFLIISIILFIIAIAFCIYVFVFDKPENASVSENKSNNASSYNINNETDENELIEGILSGNVTVEEEVSTTKNIEEVEYQEVSFYTSDDKEINLSEYKDSAVVLMFFNEESQDSMEELKKMEEIHKDYENKIKFIMINTSEEVNNNLQNEYSLEIYYDKNGTAAESYKVTEIPSIIYINKNNEVFNAKSGFTTSDALQANLDILAENI